MAKANFGAGTKEFEFFQAYWIYIKQFGTVEDSDEYWESAIDFGNTLIEKYGNDQFVKDLVLAFLKGLERKQKEIREHG